MKLFYTLLFSIAIVGSACFSADPGKKETNPEPRPKNIVEPAPSNNTEAKELPAPDVPPAKNEDAKASRTEIEAENASQNGLGPTDTVRAFYDATLKKDTQKIKSFISRSSIRDIEKSARKQGRTLDQMLTSDPNVPNPLEREFRNEVIDGNNATVEEKNVVFGRYDTVYLVKEDGNWRLALDKMQAEMIQKLNEMQQNPPDIK